jgi:hypothetical protein
MTAICAQRTAGPDLHRTFVGGARGANIALMVEVLAAGLAGDNWALDAPSFTKGDRSPGAGLLVIAIAATLLALDFPKRLALQLYRLAKLGVHIPGGASPPPRSNCPTRPWPRSNAPGRLEKVLGKRLESRPSGGQGAAKW